jgi:hypothetical protein
MKRSLLLSPIALLLASWLCAPSAQAQQYRLSHQPQTYTTLEGSQWLPMPWSDTVNPYTYVDLGGEEFTLFGEKFTLGGLTPMGISKWGNIEVMNSESAVIIDPFHSAILDSMRPSSKVSIQVTGESGDKIVRIEWKDLGFAGEDPTLHVSFQLVMHQRDGRVEFFYGPHNIDCDMTNSALQGAYVGMFIAPLDFSSIRRIFWVTGTPDDPKVSKMSIKAMKCVFPADHAVTISAPSSVAPEATMAIDAGIVAQNSIRLDAEDVKIYTVLGQEIKSVRRTEGELLLRDLPRGRYFLEYVQNGERVRRALLLE